jgi:hypothetical protein
MMRSLLMLAGAWVVWRIVNENTRRPQLAASLPRQKRVVRAQNRVRRRSR